MIHFHLITQEPIPPLIQSVLADFKHVFQDVQVLPPQRSYDHAIPLVLEAVPFNARPYHYSPQQKTKIEQQVKHLLEAGLITHSNSPFASPCLVSQEERWELVILY